MSGLKHYHNFIFQKAFFQNITKILIQFLICLLSYNDKKMYLLIFFLS